MSDPEQPNRPWGSSSRRSPPWWPEGEPWPPQGPPGTRHWHGARGRFFRRMGCVMALLILVIAGLFSALFWFTANAIGAVHLSPAMILSVRVSAGIIALSGLTGIFIMVRTIRRTAIPFGDLLEAAGRVANGDYSTRVPERGPGEMRGLAQAFNTMAERLEVNDRQRRSLLADITHELRTPITVIQGNLEGILDGIYPPDRPRIESILEETRVLSRVIDDLRTLSLAESGALKLQTETSDIAELIQDTTAAFQTQADAKGIHLSVDLGPQLPSLEIDPTRIREVITNLLANALRYTPPGGQVTVRAAADGAGEENGRVIISVSDSGSGIPAADLPHIFDRFYKTVDSRGSGLGLAIAKNLVTAHHGQISAQSQLGQGTTITFTLPRSN